jgi:hypothetical protein
VSKIFFHNDKELNKEKFILEVVNILTKNVTNNSLELRSNSYNEVTLKVNGLESIAGHHYIRLNPNDCFYIFEKDTPFPPGFESFAVPKKE